MSDGATRWISPFWRSDDPPNFTRVWVLNQVLNRPRRPCNGSTSPETNSQKKKRASNRGTPRSTPPELKPHTGGSD